MQPVFSEIISGSVQCDICVSAESERRRCIQNRKERILSVSYRFVLDAGKKSYRLVLQLKVPDFEDRCRGAVVANLTVELQNA